MFASQQMMNLISTATLVKVASITNKGENKAVGTMSVTPLINMLDGAGRAFKHGNVNNVIYCRMQGGKNAIILDPKVGDIGLVVFADRDISAVKKNKAQSNPGSGRRNDMADGIYVMTVLGDSPENSVRFTDEGDIFVTVGADNPSALVVTKDYVQMKKKGQPDLHFTVDIKNGQLLVGMDVVVAPDPNQGQP
jgi:hypothetical protein